MPTPRTMELVNSYSINEIPSSLQNKYEYDGNGLVLYAGYAYRGASISDDVWTVFYYEYTNNLVTSKTTAFGSWTNRASLSYA